MIFVVAILVAVALAGGVFALSGGNDKARKRVAAVAKPEGKARGASSPQADAASRRSRSSTVRPQPRTRITSSPEMGPPSARPARARGWPRTRTAPAASSS